MKTLAPIIRARACALLVALASQGCQGPDTATLAKAPAPSPASTPAPTQKDEPAAQPTTPPATKDDPTPPAALQRDLDVAGAAIQMGADGEPDTAGESACATFRWTSIEPEWKREDLTWNGIARTLQYQGQLRRLDARGRVLDFGEGTPHLEYDAQGNVTFRGEDPPKSDLAYRYRNTYDKKQRLTQVEVSVQAAGGKPSPYAVYRTYSYDTYGKLSQMQIQTEPSTPLTAATLSYDTLGRLLRVEWSGRKGVTQLDTFEYDERNRLVTYERDGLVIAGGRARDGIIDWRQRFRYDDTGRLRRVEAMDGPVPEQSQRDITLFSSACADVGKLLPDFYLYPYIPLPEANTPRWGG